MSSDKTLADGVVSRLVPLGPVSARRMFGGFGIYLDGAMFGLIAYDTLYFRSDERNIDVYRGAGSAPFTYNGKGKPIEMPYWRVLDDVYADPETLLEWAESALAAARRAKAKKKPQKPRPSKRTPKT